MGAADEEAPQVTDWIYFANESRAERGSTLARAKHRGLLPLRPFRAGRTTTPVPHATSVEPGHTVLLAVSTRRGWRPVAVCRVVAPKAALIHRSDEWAWEFPGLITVDDEDVPRDPLIGERTAMPVVVEREIADGEVIPHGAKNLLQPGKR